MQFVIVLFILLTSHQARFEISPVMTDEDACQHGAQATIELLKKGSDPDIEFAAARCMPLEQAPDTDRHS